MINFINLSTGRVFNGDVAYDENHNIDPQSSYVHWFDEAQSTGLTYVQKICVLSNHKHLSAFLPIKGVTEKSHTNNDIFKLISIKHLDEFFEDREHKLINDIEVKGTRYQDIQNMCTDYVVSTGAPYGSYYVHMFYFFAQSDFAMEARELFYINEMVPNGTNDNGETVYGVGDESKTFYIGADFYDEREELGIDLGNFGQDIPNSIQKAIYPANFREDGVDNILLNRKYKELLVNYMDTLANKGSYKSLINSLKWFEYPNLKIKEFWKHEEWDRLIYKDQEFEQILSKLSKLSLTNNVKTTYLGIYCACQNYIKEGDKYIYEKEIYPANSIARMFPEELLNAETSVPVHDNGRDDGQTRQRLQIGYGEIFTEPFSHIDDLTDFLHRQLIDSKNRDIQTRTSIDDATDVVTQTYDLDGANFERQRSKYKDVQRFLSEPVPALMEASYKWTKEEMSIKMAILSNYYETYFMPVHLDLIHSSIEDMVYTNALKIISGGQIDREDYIIHDTQIRCNVKDGQSFRLGDVSVQADMTTPYARVYYDGDTYKTHLIIGVSDGFGIIRQNYLSPDYADEHKTGISDQDVKTILLNSYTGPGAVIPLEFTLPVNQYDVVFKETMSTVNYITNEWETVNFENKYQAEPVDPNDLSKGYKIVIKFNLLCIQDRDYEMRVRFYCNSGMSFVKTINFNVIDTNSASLNIYKIKNVRPAVSREANKYMFTHLYESLYDATEEPIFDQNENDKNILHSTVSELQNFYTQYIPAISVEDSASYNPDGARLKMMIVMRGSWLKDGKYINLTDILNDDKVNTLPTSNDMSKNYRKAGSETTSSVGLKRQMLDATISDEARIYDLPVVTNDNLLAWTWLRNNFRVIKRYDGEAGTGRIKYLIFIANKFSLRDDNHYIDALKEYVYNHKDGCNDFVLRNELVYIPQDHYLEKLNRNTLRGLSVRPYETLCVIPNINYLRHIDKDSVEWIFRNASSGKEYSSLDQRYTLPSVKEPFIASTDQSRPVLEPGYYDITFRYKLSSEKPDKPYYVKEIVAIFDIFDNIIGHCGKVGDKYLDEYPSGYVLMDSYFEFDDITDEETFLNYKTEFEKHKNTQAYKDFMGIQEVSLKSAFIQLPLYANPDLQIEKQIEPKKSNTTDTYQLCRDYYENGTMISSGTQGVIMENSVITSNDRIPALKNNSKK